MSEPVQEPEAQPVGESEWDLLAEIRDLLRELVERLARESE